MGSTRGMDSNQALASIQARLSLPPHHPRPPHLPDVLSGRLGRAGVGVVVARLRKKLGLLGRGAGVGGGSQAMVGGRVDALNGGDKGEPTATAEKNSGSSRRRQGHTRMVGQTPAQRTTSISKEGHPPCAAALLHATLPAVPCREAGAPAGAAPSGGTARWWRTSAAAAAWRRGQEETAVGHGGSGLVASASWSRKRQGRGQRWRTHMLMVHRPAAPPCLPADNHERREPELAGPALLLPPSAAEAGHVLAAS